MKNFDNLKKQILYFPIVIYTKHAKAKTYNST